MNEHSTFMYIVQSISKVLLFRHPKQTHSIQKQKVNDKRNQSILQFTQEFVENIYCSKILYVKHGLTKQESILLSSYQNIFSCCELFISYPLKKEHGNFSSNLLFWWSMVWNDFNVHPVDYQFNDVNVKII